MTTPADVGIGEIVGKNGRAYPVYYLPPPTGETEGFFVFVPLRPAPVTSEFTDLEPGTLLIDVSKWQGDIDAQKLHDEGGVTAAYIKCTDGLGTDPKFYDNWEKFRAAGIRRGALHFWRTLDASGQRLSGTVQVNKFLSTLGSDRGGLHPGLDYEPAVISQPHATLSELVAFGDLMPDNWRLYSSTGMWAGYKLDRVKVFSADYEEPLNVMKPYTLADVALWQVGVTRLPGIDGWVDVDMAVAGMTKIDFPDWAYKHTPNTGPDKDKLYKCTAADKTALMEFCDKPRGTVHTRRIITGAMDVWKVSFLDGGWVCVVTGAKEWWTPVGNIRL